MRRLRRFHYGRGMTMVAGLGTQELALIGLVLAVPLLVIYLVIRLAVRHGVKDAQHGASDRRTTPPL